MEFLQNPFIRTILGEEIINFWCKNVSAVKINVLLLVGLGIGKIQGWALPH